MRTFHIMLTDDESLALMGLEKGVNWEMLNVKHLYKCCSKEESIHILQREKVDILITDIEMPNGSGLDLIRWVVEHKPTIHIIIYTGHAEFSYAQEALRMGVDDYLLKPILYDKLEQVLERIEQKILISEKTVVVPPEADLGGASTAEIVEKVCKLIRENLAQDLQRDELAAMVHVSPGYLGRIFKKETGLSLSDYITRKRMNMAKQLLSKTSLSITAISSRVGISYSSYFTKIFKEQFGITPQEYRQTTNR